jgi:hypothetical protein
MANGGISYRNSERRWRISVAIMAAYEMKENQWRNSNISLAIISGVMAK